MIFDKESDFEEAVIGVLVERGWEPEVIRHPTEADLLKNWADILFNNNRQRNCLNECPLRDAADHGADHQSEDTTETEQFYQWQECVYYQRQSG